jgi:hypothetical protein
MFSMEKDFPRSLPVKSYRQIRLNTKLFIGLPFSYRMFIIESRNKYKFYLDGSHKSQHHHHAPPPPHYSTFYPEMVVQPPPPPPAAAAAATTTEPVDLAAVAELDKERQTIEKSLSKLSLPIVRYSILKIK